MNKRESEAIKKRHEKIYKRLEKEKEKAKEYGRKKEDKLKETAERNKLNREKYLEKQQENHQKLIEANRDAKALGRLLGVVPPLKKRQKKQPGDFKGYYYDHQRQKFRVQFRFAGKQYRLGLYDTAETAHNVYLIERANKVAAYEKELAEYNAEITARAEKIKSERKPK